MELMRHFWDAAVELNPKAVDLDEGRRFQICKPDRLETLFTAAGLKEVEKALNLPDHPKEAAYDPEAVRSAIQKLTAELRAAWK